MRRAALARVGTALLGVLFLAHAAFAAVVWPEVGAAAYLRAQLE